MSSIKKLSQYFAIFILPLVVIACGGGGGGGSPITIAPSPQPADRFVYSGNSSGIISILRVDKVAGFANPIAFFRLPGSGFSVEDTFYDQTNQRLVVLDSRGVHVLSVNTDTGQLTLVDTYDAGATVNYSHFVLSDDASRVYAARGTSTGTQFVDTFTIQSNGSLTGPVSTALTIDPDYINLSNSKLYVVSNTDDVIHAYNLAADGSLSASPLVITTDQNPRALVFNAAGTIAYLVRSDSSQSLQVFDVAANGSFSQKDFESPGNSPLDLVLSANGLNLYVIDANGERVYHYAVDASTGSLSAVDDDNVGFTPTDITLSYTGEELYISHSQGNVVSTLTVNSSDGSLTLEGFARVFESARSVAAVGNDAGALQPTPRYLLAPDQSGLSVYAVGNNGALTLERKENIASALIDGQVAVNYNQGLLFGAGEDASGDNLVTSYQFSTSTSIATLADDVDVVDISEPVDLTRLLLGKSDRVVYVLDTKADPSTTTGDKGVLRVMSYASNGNLTSTPIDSEQTENEPRNIAIHPSGSNIYVANAQSDNFTSFSVTSSDGSLFDQGIYNPGSFDRPTDIVVHPSGRYAYASARNQTELGRLTVQSNGSLGNIQRKDTGSINPGPLAVHPSGDYLYVGGISGDANISVFPIDSTFSLGTAVTISLTDDPDWIEVEPQGRFLYVRLENGTINTFTINAATGELTDTGVNVDAGSAGGFLSTLTLVSPLQ